MHVPVVLSRCLVAALVAVVVAGCTAGARDGAARGTKRGAVGGLVAGAVGSIFFGGDAVNNALRSAAVGAASGAAIGAMDGSDRGRSKPPPKSAGQPAPAGDAALKALIGDANYAAGEELARCRHVSAIAKAERAFAAETTPERKGYALLIQAMAAEESSNLTKASEIYRRWGDYDPRRADRNAARADALDGLQKVQRLRQDNGLPALCS
jgi:hypothetical protein